MELFDAASEDGDGAAARVAAAMLAPLAESAVTEPNVVAMGLYAVALVFSSRRAGENLPLAMVAEVPTH